RRHGRRESTASGFRNSCRSSVRTIVAAHSAPPFLPSARILREARLPLLPACSRHLRAAAPVGEAAHLQARAGRLVAGAGSSLPWRGEAISTSSVVVTP